MGRGPHRPLANSWRSARLLPSARKRTGAASATADATARARVGHLPVSTPQSATDTFQAARVYGLACAQNEPHPLDWFFDATFTALVIGGVVRLPVAP
jgi:hypothetical protein